MKKFKFLLLCLSFILFYGCQDESVKIGDNTPQAKIFSHSIEGVKSLKTLSKEAVSAQAKKNLTSRTCSLRIPEDGQAVWGWGSPCYTGSECTSSELTDFEAKDLLESYVNCKVAYGIKPNECWVYTDLNATYYEAELADACSNGSIIYNPYYYLNWEDPMWASSNCDIPTEDIEAFGDFIIASGYNNAPTEEDIFVGISVHWTNWSVCAWNTADCQINWNLPDCMSPFWDSNPPCSLCRDFCSNRAIALDFNYIKKCVSDL